MKILVLCTGNSCRSHMAHGFLHSFDPEIGVFSAGTHPAEAVNPMAVEVMAEVGVDISNHTPADVALYLNDTWDYVITVCGDANETCPAFTGRVGRRLHIGFDDPSATTGTPELVKNEFIRVRDMIRVEFEKFYLTRIRERQLPQYPCKK